MIDNITTDQMDELYKSPSVKVVPVNVRGVLCQSGNERMGYEDLEDGGFH